MSKPDIILVANSPGELSALVRPMAEALSKIGKHRIILVLTPCQYASGKEIEYAKNIKEIETIISAAEYQRWMLLNQKPKNVKFCQKGIVLFLGGDLTHAVLIAKKLKYPACAYLNERIAWKRFYQKFFVKDDRSFRKFAKQVPIKKLRFVGDLMVDAVAHLNKWEPQENVITFMPGSRRWEIDYMTPLYKEVMELIKREVKNAKFQIVNSPFAKALPVEGTKKVEFDQIHNSEIVITIPGT
ncbi:MAG: hypothetical protein ACPL4K_06375, partial [Candidatus Margulisiibacteriota bacterium]